MCGACGPNLLATFILSTVYSHTHDIMVLFAHQKLQVRVKELDLQHRSHSKQAIEVSDLEYSSSSVSVGNLDTSTSSIGEEGDTEQGWAKYREMKVKSNSQYTQYICCHLYITYTEGICCYERSFQEVEDQS